MMVFGRWLISTPESAVWCPATSRACGLSLCGRLSANEIVCLDGKGVSQFNALLTTKGRDAAAFYAFDLIWLNGADLRRKPLVERKARLCELIRKSRCPRLLYAQHVDAVGKEFFNEICRCDLEGIVGKRKMGLYREDRPDWLKIKNRTYSQAEGRHELLTRKKN